MRLIVVLIVGCFFSALGCAAAQHPQPHAAETALRDGWERAHHEAVALTPTKTLGIHVVRLRDGAPLLSLYETVSRNPASNMKLVTSAVALKVLGPRTRFRTRFYGRYKKGDWKRLPALLILGGGDPSLDYAALREVAFWIKARKITHVDEIVVDASVFDDQLVPPAFEQQPEESASFRASVAGLAVDKAAYFLGVRPGKYAGEPLKISSPPQSYLRIVNQGSTIKKGEKPTLRIEEHSDEQGRLVVTISGSLPVGARSRGRWRRVPDPRIHAGFRMIDALKAQGIKVKERVRLGDSKEGMYYEVFLYAVDKPFADYLRPLGKQSSNFYAEMLLKKLGATQAKPGTSKAGLEVVQGTLTSMGLDLTGSAFVNGSGLFEGNLLTPKLLTGLLRRMYQDPQHFVDYLAHLPRAGLDGTLRKRKLGTSPDCAIYAKTGTLDDVVALSGYVLTQDRNQDLAFSILLNELDGKTAPAKDYIDRIAGQFCKLAGDER